MIRLDMSEYMEKHSVSRLVGAPPGYVGHGEGGELTEKVRRKPYALILLDELEKAHRDVCNILLQIMEDGVLTDTLGRTVDFKNTTIVMTSNLGGEEQHRGGLGFQPSSREERVQNCLRAHFPAEFLGRIDCVAQFRPLDETALTGIAEKLLEDTASRAPCPRRPGAAGQRRGGLSGPGLPGPRGGSPGPAPCHPAAGGGPAGRPAAAGGQPGGGGGPRRRPGLAGGPDPLNFPVERGGKRHRVPLCSKIEHMFINWKYRKKRPKIPNFSLQKFSVGIAKCVLGLYIIVKWSKVEEK